MWIGLYALAKLFAVILNGEPSGIGSGAEAQPESSHDVEITDAQLDDLWYQYWLRTWF